MLRGLLCGMLLAGMAGGQELRLNSFESDAEMSEVIPRDARVRLTDQGVTHGTRALAIEFGRVAFPALFFRPPKPWDVREWGEIAYDITNPGTTPVRFSVRVDDDYRSDGVGTSRNGVGTLEPGATATFAFPLASRNPMEFGMRGLPVGADARNLGSFGTHVLNLANLAQMQIFLVSPAETVTLLVDNVRLRAAMPLEGIVDRFGQYAPGSWPGKLASEEEFAGHRAAEEAFLGATGTFGGRAPYGGYAAGPRLEGTGYFRVAKSEGRWWLVDPDGWLFFSTGFNSVSLAQTTFTTGREAMFSWLPPGEDPLAQHYGTATAVQGPIPSGRTYNFHTANLERKYGAEYVEEWRRTTLARLPAWGFNTIGNWSDPGLHRRGVAYVTTASLWGSYNTVPNVGQGTDRLPDPFDPRFAGEVNARLLPVLTPALGDPWCLGHFVDNELNWGSTASDRTRYGVVLGALGQAVANSPARRALGGLLASKYGAVSNLNAAWGTAFADWNALTAPAAVTAGMRADLGMLTTAFAREYFRVVRQEIRRIDPHHLYLGSRFHVNNPDVIVGAAEMTDVLSFNIYQTVVAPASWTILGQVDRPAIIGEFHFGALDRGMFHTGLQSTGSQAERAAALTRYLNSVIDHPNFVGAHWFQYTDQAITGRPRDGENYNIGFVNVVDVPYPEMVNAARDLHEGLYGRRLR